MKTCDNRRHVSAGYKTFQGRQGLFGFASKKYDPIKDLDERRWNRLKIYTRYYNTDLHRGAFALPNYVLDILKEG